MKRSARALLVVLLVGVGMALSGAQVTGDAVQLLEFINLQSDCPPNCPPNAPVCCYKAPDIIVEG
ncbi:MAG: hypothetical protein ACE5HV_17995 [Acidobacteriota bacterium]